MLAEIAIRTPKVTILVIWDINGMAGKRCLAKTKAQILHFGSKKTKSWQAQTNHFSYLWIAFPPDASSEYVHWQDCCVNANVIT